MTRLAGMALVRWLERQVETARETRDLYLVALTQQGWTSQGQQMLDGVSDNLAYFERELGEARLCLQLKNWG
ncbi:MAG: hypothetical protein DRI81_18965 [Chloroflexi bacterium]|nr:MAG: hypothetical protein DRI81_18965 [Chloroflexota bacterium]